MFSCHHPLQLFVVPVYWCTIASNLISVMGQGRAEEGSAHASNLMLYLFHTSAPTCSFSVDGRDILEITYSLTSVERSVTYILLSSKTRTSEMVAAPGWELILDAGFKILYSLSKHIAYELCLLKEFSDVETAENDPPLGAYALNFVAVLR